ncbi:hypothetical protein AcV5_007404 [Taiwanofungus camphoratus]|nr:hypothetical protein AcV5_007404 [Antrodia cinnamomea]
MPLTLKRSRRVELTRSLVDVVKSIYTSDRTRRELAFSKTVDSSNIRLRKHYGSRKQHRIMRLPNELLAHIFVLGAEDDGMFAVTVSHVCRAWRSLALHTPSLWRRVSLDSRLYMWKYRIYRAKACTLDIQLIPRHSISEWPYYTDYIDVHTVQSYMHLVTPYMRRWRSLEIRFELDAPYLWNAALSACCGHSPSVQAVALQKLSLVYPGNDDTKEFTLFGGYAPRLREVTLCGIRLAWLPSLFQNLTFLDYTHHGFTRGLEAASEVLYLLQVSHRLEQLRIAFPWRGDSATRYLVPTPHPVRLPHLRSLEVSIQGPDIPSALTYVLLRFSAPSVRTLHLASRYPFRRPTIFPRLRHVLRALPHFPLLEDLQLEHGWLDPNFVFPLLHSLPCLRRLAVAGPRVTGPFLIGLTEALRARQFQGKGVLPLKVLELDHCETLSAEAIVDSVKRRSGASSLAFEALHIRECTGVNLSALRRLKGTGMQIRTWARGMEIDFAKMSPC